MAESRNCFWAGVRGRRRLVVESEFRGEGVGSVSGEAEEVVIDA